MSLTLQDYLAIGFTLGLTIIYVPQYYKIIKMKSSVGFHPWYVFLGYMASTVSCINAVIYYWDAFVSSINWLPYIQSISGYFLLVFQWFLFLIFYIVFVKYFKQETVESSWTDPIPPNIASLATEGEFLPEEDFFKDEMPDSTVTKDNDHINIEVPLVYTTMPIIHGKNSSKIKQKGFSAFKTRLTSIFAMRTKRSNVLLFTLSQAIGTILLLITLVSILLKKRFPSTSSYVSSQSISPPDATQDNNITNWIHIWSYILEMLTLIMFCLHYAPQIWETFRLKKVGSLSLITLGIMCPGTFVWTYFLANQSNASLSIWLPYLSVGIMQAILLIIGIYYEVRDRYTNNRVLTL